MRHADKVAWPCRFDNNSRGGTGMKRQKYACGWRLPWLAAMLGLAVLLAAAGYKWREQPDFSSNPYVFYERGITARIGAYAPYAFMDKGGTLDGYVMDLTYAISRD